MTFRECRSYGPENPWPPTHPPTHDAKTLDLGPPPPAFLQLTKDLNKSKENPENWSKKPKEAKAPAAGVAHTKTLVPRDADASTLSVPKPQRTDSSSSGPNVSESASSKAHSASVAAPPDTRTEHRSDAAPPKQQPSNGRPASASEVLRPYSAWPAGCAATDVCVVLGLARLLRSAVGCCRPNARDQRRPT